MCRLKRALYGLRQARRQWHTRLDVVMRKLGLAPTKADPYLYRARQGKKFIIALVYVDDILLASQDLGWIKPIKHGIAKRFDVKDLGKARQCFRIKI